MSVFFVGFLVGIISSWLTPFNVHMVMGINKWAFMFILTLTGAFISKFLLPLTPAKTALKLGLGVLAAYFLRVLYDTTFVDPTSHNLLPFEIIMVSFISFPAAFAGVYLAQISKWLKRKSNRD